MTGPYQARTEANATVTASRAAAIVSAYKAGTIQRPELPSWLGPIIRAGAARAVSMADAALAAQLGQLIERPGQVPALGLVLPDETADEIDQGVESIVSDEPDEPATDTNDEDDAEDLATRVDRLATAAPLDAGQEAHQDAMSAQRVPGWLRQTDADPCPLCAKLADAKVIGIDKRMIRHPGCSCVAVPVLTGAQPFQRPDEGPHDPREFVPTTLRTGHGLAGRQYTRAAPGLTISRTIFIPSRKAVR